MRAILSVTAVAIGLLAAGRAFGQPPAQPSSVQTPAPVVEEGPYTSGGHLGHRLCRPGWVHPLCLGCGGRDPGDNCACHGSYKYPVPSQSTFFWPGIYSADTMTQYISPLRYPGLKPIPEHWKLDPTDDTSPYSGYRY